jgi:activating signal cointegrator complex subunit 3
MVFVHARNATVSTAERLRDLATQEGTIDEFKSEDHPYFMVGQKAMEKARSKQVKDLFGFGLAVHHAGLLRPDRNLVESLFSKGVIKVLCCTATLAWGVNLPAHAVVIRGTQLYDAQKGSFIDLGILDVMQIFGRAGRPQFDTFGEATLITTHDKLTHYLGMMTRQLPIESRFVSHIADHLCAEVSLGTVATIEEAVKWISYTYLFVRMRRNPMVYGISQRERDMDPELLEKRLELAHKAARALDAARMVRFVERTGFLHATDLGRVASFFYIRHASIELFNESFKPHMTEADILAMISQSNEFENIKVRDDEIGELENLMHDACWIRPVKGGAENAHGKVNILLQVCFLVR